NARRLDPRQSPFADGALEPFQAALGEERWIEISSDRRDVEGFVVAHPNSRLLFSALSDSHQLHGSPVRKWRPETRAYVRGYAALARAASVRARGRPSDRFVSRAVDGPTGLPVLACESAPRHDPRG